MKKLYEESKNCFWQRNTRGSINSEAFSSFPRNPLLYPPSVCYGRLFLLLCLRWYCIFLQMSCFSAGGGAENRNRRVPDITGDRAKREVRLAV